MERKNKVMLECRQDARKSYEQTQTTRTALDLTRERTLGWSFSAWARSSDISDEFKCGTLITPSGRDLKLNGEALVLFQGQTYGRYSLAEFTFRMASNTGME